MLLLLQLWLRLFLCCDLDSGCGSLGASPAGPAARLRRGLAAGVACSGGLASSSTIFANTQKQCKLTLRGARAGRTQALGGSWQLPAGRRLSSS